MPLTHSMIVNDVARILRLMIKAVDTNSWMYPTSNFFPYLVFDVHGSVDSLLLLTRT